MESSDLDTVLNWRNSDEVRRHMLSDAIIDPKSSNFPGVSMYSATESIKNEVVAVGPNTPS